MALLKASNSLQQGQRPEIMPGSLLATIGGRAYRAAAVGRVISEREACGLGRDYIVAINLPVAYVFWKNCYAKIQMQ